MFGISKKNFNWADKKYMVSEGYFTFEWISGLCFLTNSLILQVIYFTLSQVGWSRHAPLVFHLTDVPVPSMIIIFLWPIVALAICELFKRRYIKWDLFLCLHGSIQINFCAVLKNIVCWDEGLLVMCLKVFRYKNSFFLILPDNDKK